MKSYYILAIFLCLCGCTPSRREPTHTTPILQPPASATATSESGSYSSSSTSLTEEVDTDTASSTGNTGTSYDSKSTKPKKPKRKRGPTKSDSKNSSKQGIHSSSRTTVVQPIKPDIQCENVINPKSHTVYFSNGNVDNGFKIFIDKMKSIDIEINSNYYKGLTVKYYDSTGRLVIISGQELVSKDFFELAFDDRGMKTKWLDKLKAKTASMTSGINLTVNNEQANHVCCQ